MRLWSRWMRGRRRSLGLAPGLQLAVVLFGVLLCATISFIGYIQFRLAFERQYERANEQVAYMAASYVDGKEIVAYLNHREPMWDWEGVRRGLLELVERGDLDGIRVTVPDTVGYGSQLYVFDAPGAQRMARSGAHVFGDVEPLADVEPLRRLMQEGTPYTAFAYGEGGGSAVTSIPVRDAGGAPVAVLSVEKSLTEMRQARLHYMRAAWIAALACAAVFIGVYSYYLLFKVVRPIQLITAETEYFARHEGSLSGALRKIRSQDELGTLARAVEKMSKQMNDYISELTKVTSEKEYISAELDVACQIQAGMLPKEYPPFPGRTDFDLFGAMYPAKEVGGDLYDYMLLDGDHLMLAVGDVSGKGVPASLFMVIAKTLLSSHAAEGLTPGEIFSKTNNQLCDNKDGEMFVTCWLGIVTLSTGELIFANAGHPPPVLYHGGKFSFLKTTPNLVLAGMPGMKYVNYKVTLSRGDRLLIYTDGVTEATDSRKRLFGDFQLLKVMRQTEGLNAQEAAAWLKLSIDAFADLEPQYDDITMLSFRLI